MRNRARRQLAGLDTRRAAGVVFHLRDVTSISFKSTSMVPDVLLESRIEQPPELSFHDYTILLLDVAAEIEHALMVEYLYAAYSLGGPQVPPKYRRKIREWQEIILGIAKEEMGHLLTVQNVLRLLGGALNLDREDYPWGNDFYPFPFKLEPLTKNSLARYVYAESPADWNDELSEEIKKAAEKDATKFQQLHTVSELYKTLIQLLKSDEPKYLQDSDFLSDTYPYQASWDEWGRGYREGARGNSLNASVAGAPDIIVRSVASRDAAIQALEAVAQQGEAPERPDAKSHFFRFLEIYREFRNITDWQPTRNVPTNPYASMDLNPEDDESADRDGTPIIGAEAKAWAHLFNIRYRMVLSYIVHTFELSSIGAASNSPRGLLVHSAFAEMYNMRAIANFLVDTPIADGDDDTQVAGPPFQMPYTLKLPFEERDRWRLHRDRLDAASGLIQTLIGFNNPLRQDYLRALKSNDLQTSEMIDRISEKYSKHRR